MGSAAVRTAPIGTKRERARARTEVDIRAGIQHTIHTYIHTGWAGSSAGRTEAGGQAPRPDAVRAEERGTADTNTHGHIHAERCCFCLQDYTCTVAHGYMRTRRLWGHMHLSDGRFTCVSYVFGRLVRACATYGVTDVCTDILTCFLRSQTCIVHGHLIAWLSIHTTSGAKCAWMESSLLHGFT